jgi:hypothetical protein
MSKKKCYYLRSEESEYGGLAIVHESSKKAKNFGVSNFSDLLDLDPMMPFIEQKSEVRIKYLKNVDCEKYPIGHAFIPKTIEEQIDMLKIGVYNHFYDTCPVCKETEKIVSLHNNIACCDECSGKI